MSESVNKKLIVSNKRAYKQSKNIHFCVSQRAICDAASTKIILYFLIEKMPGILPCIGKS